MVPAVVNRVDCLSCCVLISLFRGLHFLLFQRLKHVTMHHFEELICSSPDVQVHQRWRLLNFKLRFDLELPHSDWLFGGDRWGFHHLLLKHEFVLV